MRHEFIDRIPARLEEGVLYISLAYATAVHKCACGCGYEVVTPFSPTDWHMLFNGETVSLLPSIGNWSFQCRSHYWIERGRVAWAPDMSDLEIKRVRSADARRKSAHYDLVETKAVQTPMRRGWKRLFDWFVT